MSTVSPASLLHWPRTLFARLALILVVGLALAQTFSFLLTMRERDDSMTHMMVGYVEREVASSVALLDHLPPDERAAWLPRLARRSYTFILGPGETGAPLDAALSERFARSIGEGIGKRYPLTVNAVPGDKERFQVHLRLSDGSPLTIDMRPMVGTPLSGWLPLVLVLQLIVLGGCCWLAVRLRCSFASTAPSPSRSASRCWSPGCRWAPETFGYPLLKLTISQVAPILPFLFLVLILSLSKG